MGHSLIAYDHIGGVMISVLVSSAVNFSAISWHKQVNFSAISWHKQVNFSAISWHKQVNFSRSEMTLNGTLINCL
jgi:hypothetical protein